MPRKPRATAEVHPKARKTKAGTKEPKAKKPVSKVPAQEPVKRVPWRPTDYRPEFCERVIEWGRAGKSRTWIAAELEVNRDTLYAWMEAHPDFSDALTRAKVLEQRWWEDKGQDSLETTGFCQTMWARNMTCRFPKEWQESTNVNHGAQDSFLDLMKLVDGSRWTPASG
jgi:hypothetical protein